MVNDVHVPMTVGFNVRGDSEKQRIAVPDDAKLFSLYKAGKRVERVEVIRTIVNASAFVAA